MSRLLIYMLPGILLDILIVLADAFLVPAEIKIDATYNILCPVVQLLLIVIPCIVYFIKMPPGTNTKP